MPAARAITGAAGAYFAVAELSQLGWIASPTWGNAPRTDVLAQRADGSRIASIQVKTRLSGPDFLLGNTIPVPTAEGGNEWFIFVSLHGPGARPDFYVVPRDHVVALAHCGTNEWLSHPRRDGQPRTTKRVNFKVAYVERYREQWALLDHDANVVPWMIPEWVWGLAEKWRPPVTLGPFARP